VPSSVDGVEGAEGEGRVACAVIGDDEAYAVGVVDVGDAGERARGGGGSPWS